MPDEISGVTTSTPSDAGATQAVGSPPAQDGSGGAPSEQPVDAGVTSPVQGASDPTDIWKDLPAVDELKSQAEQGVKYAAALANLRGVVEPIQTQHAELSERFKVFEPVADRFENTESLQQVLSLHDGIIGWNKSPTGELEPATEVGAQFLHEKYPLHADFLTADLLKMETVDPDTGQRMPRIDMALKGMAQDATARAKVAQIFGFVEPSSISPQWQPSQEELDVLVTDPERGATPQELAYQEEYKKVPYDKRQNLRVNDPEFIKEYLDDQKFKRDTRERETRQQESNQQAIQRQQQYVNQQADAAGEQYVSSRLSETFTTFANNVVEQCNLIEALDPANLPQGMTAEQATEMNRQITNSNKSVAAEIILSVVGVFNPETRPFALPFLRETGVLDDKMVKQIEEASGMFSDNGRKYGELEFRGKASSNGAGYQPGQDVLNLRNTSDQKLKLMTHIANQIKARLIEQHSQTFSLKAQNHNQTLDSRAVARPIVNGSVYDPTTAPAQQPQGFMTKAEIVQRYG